MGEKNMGNTHPAVQTNATKQYNSTTYNKYNNIYIYHSLTDSANHNI
jgi:hypothetical protein